MPVFSPPTWMVLAYLQIAYNPNLLALTLVGAAAASAGRLLLARFANTIRAKFLSNKAQRNLDELRERLETKKEVLAGGILLFALSPLPSNQLFLAYGLTGLPLSRAILPFFGGRFFSYFFWIFTADRAAEYLPENIVSKMLGPYFILSQLLTLFTVWLFTRIDWKTLINHRKFRLLKEELKI